MARNPVIMFMKDVCKRVIMLNAWFVMSTHGLILLKGYAIILKFGLSCL